MSYDLYCYKSKIGKPDVNEAQEIIELQEDTKNEEISHSEIQLMEKIADSLIKFDPKLERFQRDYKKIAEDLGVTQTDAEKHFKDIELNTPENNDFLIQINIFKDNVSVNFPFSSPNETIDQVLKYTEVICKTAGYFVYDPQDESVYDPLHSIQISDEERKSWIENDEINYLDEKKPWWKFW